MRRIFGGEIGGERKGEERSSLIYLLAPWLKSVTQMLVGLAALALYKSVQASRRPGPAAMATSSVMFSRTLV